MKPIRAALRDAELWSRWLDLAAERGLNAGSLPDLGTAIARAGVCRVARARALADDPALYLRPADAERVLDELVALARLRTDAFRIEERDGLPAIALDLQGLEPNLGRLAEAFRYAVAEAQRALVVAESRQAGAIVERVARRWAMSPRQLYRWRAEADKTPPAMSGQAADSAPKRGAADAA